MNGPIDAERYLLSGLLLENSRFEEIDVSPDDFINEQHAAIFQTCLRLISESSPADVLTVANRLTEETGKEWLIFVGQVAHTASSAANVSSYARIVKAAAGKRKALAIAETLSQNVNDAEAVDIAIRDLMALDTTRRNYDFTLKDALVGAVEELDKAHSAAGGIIGVRSGLEKLDGMLGGFRNSDLIVIGARPAMGKTGLMLNFANSSGVPCGIISAEQGHEQIGLRLVSIDGRISSQKMRLAKFDESDWVKLTRTVSRMQPRKLWINDKPAPTITDIVRQARKWKFQYGIKILYVDYLQRIKGDSKLPMHEQVRNSVMAMKELARELEIPVVALSQVARAVETRPNKRPGMADLSDSSSIEKEADQIITLYRDEVYNEDTPDKGIAELLVCKNRHGPTGFVRAVWIGEFMRFEDMAYTGIGHES